MAARTTSTKRRKEQRMVDAPVSRQERRQHRFFASRAFRLRLVVSCEAVPTIARRSICQRGLSTPVKITVSPWEGIDVRLSPSRMLCKIQVVATVCVKSKVIDRGWC